ncbi:MAG: hypothetical protein ACLP36_12245 [Acidimicrobiales bacterium]
MAKLSAKDQAFLEDLLQMGGGYVLNFSNTTFGQFIARHMDIDIWDQRYEYGSGSKANRLRGFWDVEDDETVGRLLVALLEYIDTEVTLEHMSADGFKPKVVQQCQQIARRLLGDSLPSSSLAVADDPAVVEAFLREDFKHLGAAVSDLEGDIQAIIQSRLAEVESIIGVAPLAAIFLIASTLEGILLDVAMRQASVFIEATAAPRRDGTVQPVDTWRLAALIDVAHELGFVEDDVRRFSHHLRDYRNFIHPRAQARAAFHPTPDTAKICFQVLKAAVTQVNARLKTLRAEG